MPPHGGARRGPIAREVESLLLCFGQIETSRAGGSLQRIKGNQVKGDLVLRGREGLNPGFSRSLVQSGSFPIAWSRSSPRAIQFLETGASSIRPNTVGVAMSHGRWACSSVG